MQIVLDAHGNVPAPLTDHELRLAEKTHSGGMKKALHELELKQAWSLDEKIVFSLEIIRAWYEAFEGKVAVSFSGGKDSSVLLWLVRQIDPQVPAVFGHTGLEYPEVVRHVMDTPNHVILRPKMNFNKVISTYGWPLASKKVARGVSVVQNPTVKNGNIRRLYIEGINRFGKPTQGFKVPEQWRFLFYAPFKVSDKCCEIMKKRPMAAYERKSGNVQFVGTMATDSKQRQKNYLEYGCNAYDMKRPRSAPLSFWTEQDILECIFTYKIKIPSVYGEIKKEYDKNYLVPPQGKAQHFITTGVRRTGCLFCCFGLAQDEGMYNRFELLAKSHPKLHRYVMDRVGLRDVLKYCQKHACESLDRAFRCGG